MSCANVGDVLAFPSHQFAGHLVFEILEVNFSQLPHRKREDQVFHRERGSGCRYDVKDMVQIKVVASYGHHRAFIEVGAKACRIVETPQNGLEIVDVPLDWGHENSCVVHVERCSHHGTSATNLVNDAFTGCQVEDLMQRVNRDDKEQRRKGVSLLKPTAMLDRGTRHAIEKKVRRGRGKQRSNPTPYVAEGQGCIPT